VVIVGLETYVCVIGTGKGHVDMKNKVVKVSLPHFTCHISMPDLAKNIIAVSSILSVKKTKARKHARSV